MIKLLFAPLGVIEEQKNSKGVGKFFLTLFLAALFTSIGFLVLTKGTTLGIGIGIGVLIGMFIGGIILAYLLKVAFSILSKETEYWKTMAIIANGFFVLAIGLFVASLFTLLPTIGIVISALIMLWAFTASSAVTYRTATELLQVDLLVVIVAIVIIQIAIFSGIYFVLLSQLPTLYSAMPLSQSMTGLVSGVN